MDQETKLILDEIRDGLSGLKGRTTNTISHKVLLYLSIFLAFVNSVVLLRSPFTARETRIKDIEKINTLQEKDIKVLQYWVRKGVPESKEMIPDPYKTRGNVKE